MSRLCRSFVRRLDDHRIPNMQKDTEIVKISSAARAGRKSDSEYTIPPLRTVSTEMRENTEAHVMSIR